MNKENFKVVSRMSLSNKEYEEIRLLYNDDKYLNNKILFTNLLYGKDFFVVGKLNDKIIASVEVHIHPEQNDFFLITELYILDEYKNTDYKEQLLDDTIAIITDMNCSKVGAFVEKVSVSEFTNIGFVKKSSDYIFGNEKGSIISSADPYYELIIKQDYYLTNITKENARVLEKLLWAYGDKYASNIPNFFKPNLRMYRSYLLSLNKDDHEQAYVIMKGKTICGYTYMFYENDETQNKSDHNVYFYITLGENYLYKDAFKIALAKVIQYANEKKNEHKLEKIKFYVNDSLMIKEQFDFYKRVLQDQGFKSDDEELYYLNI